LLITDKLKLDGVLNYRKVQVEGNYNLSKQIFIDNKVHQGKTGVHVLTPLKLNNSEYSILINRGWVEFIKDRSVLPQIKTPENTLTLSGRLKVQSKPPFTVGEQFQSNQGWPALMQWINFSEIEKKSGMKLLPYIFLLDKEEQSGYAIDWKPVVMQPEKSTSYAVQWFSLAVVLIIIYIVVNFKKKESELENGK